MQFRIADTFTDSLGRLTRDEQKAVKTTAFDLQLNPANPGMRFHRIERCKDPGFWSVRAGRDLRVIVHKSQSSLLLCYVDHHDRAYAWAERRRLERHPRTGAAQLVEVRETVREVEIPNYVVRPAAAPPKPLLLKSVTADDLLGYGVPPEWVDDALAVTEDNLFEVAEHLPREAAEALLELATGSKPPVPVAASEEDDPFAHPDAVSRFRVMADVEELERALDAPWDRWAVFLHPSQEELVEKNFNGPARVSGSAGTGKTIVALHRAVHLARKHADIKVLLTTFSESLARALRRRLRLLVGNDEKLAGRVTVEPLPSVAAALYRDFLGEPQVASDDQIAELLAAAGREVDRSQNFLETEWSDVVDAWQIDCWEDYRNVPRLGRKTRLGEPQRCELWRVFEEVRSTLDARNLLTQSMLFARVTESLARGGEPSPFDFVVVDEAQDISVAELRFLAAVTAQRPSGLFFAGDLGQRIFRAPFSWKALGIDIRGRSSTLRINYRTSHQIRSQADRLLPGSISDVDGIAESRGGTISVFNGPAPQIWVLDDAEEEIEAVAQWLSSQRERAVAAHEICIIVRSADQLPRAHQAMDAAGINAVELDSKTDVQEDHAAIVTMHEAKGLEFRAVAVIACDDEVLPLQERIESVSDASDLEEVYNTERHLLYVACTRARDHLLVTATDPASEFLDDFGG